MYDKSVRRRRITLALLVASSLLLLTVYFGESAGGGLHSVQKGVLEVVSPIQEGASRALKPVRDLAGWFGDTLDAKNDVDALRKQNAQLRGAAVAGTEAVRQNRQLQGLLGLDRSDALGGTRPVTARVIGQSPTIWYSTIQIDKGTTAGVRAGQPVITADGLAGQVTFAAGGSAVVTLITDGDIAVSARVSENGVTGVVETGQGGPRDLQLKYAGRDDRLEKGFTIVTAGTTSDSDRLQSVYPPGIPIGEITAIHDPETDTQAGDVRPFADLRRLEFVQVLTAAPNGNRGDRAR